MTDFVSPPLQGENSTTDEGPDEVVRLKLPGVHQARDAGRDLGILLRLVGRAPSPVEPGVRGAGNICRQVEDVLSGVVLDVEVCPESLLRRGQALNSDERDLLPRRQGSRPALHQRLDRQRAALDRLGSEVVVLGPVVQTGPQTEIAFEQAGEGGEEDKCICGKMMWLQTELFEERPEEITGGEAEPPLEMGDEDDALALLRCRRDLALRRQAAIHLGRHPAGFPKPVQVGLRHL